MTVNPAAGAAIGTAPCHSHADGQPWPASFRVTTVFSPLFCRYEAGEMERAQLREAVLKHKAEMEVLAEEHTAELTAMTAAHETELAVAAKHRAALEKQLQEASSQLAQAQVRMSRTAGRATL